MSQGFSVWYKTLVLFVAGAASFQLRASAEPSSEQLVVGELNPTDGPSQPFKVSQGQSSRFSFPPNFKPPGEGRPKKTTGAGARDGLRCEPSGSAIRAIAPPQGYGLTLQERPEIWLDLGTGNVPQVLLVFKTEAGAIVERMLLPVDAGQPLQRFSLPETSIALEVGRNYQWSLLIACDGTVNPSNPIFSGWVQRVAQASSDQAEILSAGAQVQAYAQAGYWYDAISTLLMGLEADATDQTLTSLWKEVLALIHATP